MRLTRARFTVRRLMVLVALIALLLAWPGGPSRRGSRLIVWDYPNVIENEPLRNPVRVRAFDGRSSITLEDGRVLEIVDDQGRFSGSEQLLDLQNEAGGAVSIYVLQPPICGCRDLKEPFVSIPVFPYTVYRNARSHVGKGRFSKGSAASSRG